MKPQLTIEQIAKRDERRAKFRALWKTIAALTDVERVALSHKYGFRKLDGSEFSVTNSCLLALQSPTGSVFGGFRDWLKHGRAVRKGEHGSMIFFPIGTKSENPETGAITTVMDEKRFGMGTVFEIGQTEPVEAAQAAEQSEKRFNPQAELVNA